MLMTAMTAAAGTVSLTVQADKTVHRIDEKIYGHFLEHIFHSCNGGLWGEQVWNRSFEQNNAGRFRTDGDNIVQEGLGANIRLVFGDRDWKDYEYSLEAMKTGGEEGFLVLFRVQNEEEFYWYNIGGWGNKRHGLEKGVKGERWGTKGPITDGIIEEKKWYNIRVRCEGPKIQVWLDNKQVLDFKDEKDAHLTGQVGIGTWATKARFRNIKVSSLDGKVLLEGAPAVMGRPLAAEFWETYGDVTVETVSEGAFNSDAYQRIICAKGEGGLQQAPFFIQKREKYYGSLWTKGNAENGLVVRLIDGKTVFDEANLDAPGSTWEERTFTFKSSREVRDAVLQIGTRDGGDVCIDQVSLMSKDSMKTGGFRPDLLEAVAELKPPIIRWPGGCFASPYRWKDGIGKQQERRVCPREMWGDLDVNSYGTDEFIAMCRKIGAEPLIVVNIGCENWNPGADPAEFLQDALDWIEYCNGPVDSKWGKVRAGNGHPKPYNVKYWEIDNETWHMGEEKYCEAVLKFAPAMRKADPTIKLAACGSGGFNHKWNRAVIDQCAAYVDYLSIHHYESPDKFADGPLNYEKFFRETGDYIALSKNPKMKIYVSEWNAQSTDWRTGLYCGGLLNAFERCGDVLEIGGPALFLRHVSAKSWDNAFINFDHTGWFPAPNYVVMKLWRDHYAPNLLKTEGDTKGLNISVSKSENGKALYIKAVNPGKEPVDLEINISNFDISRGTMELVSPGELNARNTMATPGAVRPVKVDVEMKDGKVKAALPALSAGVITITGKSN